MFWQSIVISMKEVLRGVVLAKFTFCAVSIRRVYQIFCSIYCRLYQQEPKIKQKTYQPRVYSTTFMMFTSLSSKCMVVSVSSKETISLGINLACFFLASSWVMIWTSRSLLSRKPLLQTLQTCGLNWNKIELWSIWMFLLPSALALLSCKNQIRTE